MRVLGLWTICFCVGIVSAAAQETEVSSLAPGRTFAREIADGQVHTYLVELNTYDFLHAVFEQNGVDIVIVLSSPEGKTLKEIDSLNGAQGPEPILLIAESTGTYRLDVRVFRERGSGKYAVRLEQKRPATTEDRERADKQLLAEQAYRLGAQSRELMRQGRGMEARPIAERALALVEKAFGTEDRELLPVLVDLANLFQDQGEYALALPLRQRVLSILEKSSGPKNIGVATALNDLGLLYLDIGNYPAALPILQRSLALREDELGPEHPDVATTLNNLALLYQNSGEFARALPLHLRALAIREKALGPQHPHVALSLNNLAYWYQTQGEYTRAEPLLERSLAIREKVFGPEHNLVAQSLNNLGNLARAKGDYVGALPLYQRSLAIRERIFGPEHPIVGTVLDNLGTLFQAQGLYREAVVYRRRVAELREKNLTAILAAGSQHQKQLYLDTLSRETYATVSLHVQGAPLEADAARLALTTILQRKGRALDAFAGQLEALGRRSDPEQKQSLDNLTLVQSQLASLQLGGGQLAPAARRSEITRLVGEQERLEDAVSRRSAEYRAAVRPISFESVRAALPPSAALVELFVYRPFNAKEKYTERLGPPRYVAYVVKPGASSPAFADLGDAASIDAAAASFRTALSSPKTPIATLKASARKLDESVMRPLRKLLDGTDRVFLAPDGGLNLVPFEAFVNETGEFLIEHYEFNYVTSGSDLLRQLDKRANGTAPVIFANPLFNLKQGTPNATVSPKPDGVQRLQDLAELRLKPLPGTAREAAALNRLFPDSKVFSQAGATEAVLKEVRHPRLLHIATHGFFFPDRSTKIAGCDSPTAACKSVGELPDGSQDNPLLRSGLILAGVNQRQSGPGEDGVLTALEAAGLDLFGTELVVLSACETGLGEIQNGQGVFGLRRALVLAGSETQVMTLWRVSDASTRDLMSAYYGRLRSGEGRVAALRQTKLAMMRGKAADVMSEASWRHPYFWAGFIVSGGWGPLNI